MADSREIDITIKVDAEGAVTLLGKTGEKLEDVGKQGAKASEGISSADSALSSIKTAAGIAAGAIAAVGVGFAALIPIAQRGSDINDVADALSNLSEKAGTTSDTLLNDLKQATGGTISDFDLMKTSVSALRANIKPDELITLTNAARALADQVGGDTKQEFESLLFSFQKGDDRFLKSRGIIIDNQKAFEAYALKLGTTADALSEVGKAQAIQEASLRALIPVAKEGAAIQNDIGDSINAVKTAITNQFDAVAKSVAANEDFNKALSDIATTISTIDFKPFIDALGTSLSAVSKLISYIADPGLRILGAFKDALNQITDPSGAGKLVQTAEAVSSSFDKINNQIKNLKDASGVAKIREELDRMKVASEALDKQGIFTGSFTPSINFLSQSLSNAEKKLRDTADSTQDLKKQEIEAAVKTENLSKAQKEAAKAAEALSTANEKLDDVISKLSGTKGPVTELGNKLREIFSAAASGQIKPEVLKEKLEELSKGFRGSKEDVAKFAEELGQAKEAVDKLVFSLDDLIAATPGLGLATEALKRVPEELERIQKELEEKSEQTAKDFGNAIGGALGEAINAGISGNFNSDTISDILGGLGGQGGSFAGGGIGATIGFGLGGPLGAAIGESLGASLGETFGQAIFENIAEIGQSTAGTIAGSIDTFFPGIGTLMRPVIDNLFSEDAGTTARKGADRFFADAFDVNRLSLIINGQMQEITDLVFEGDTLFGGNVDFSDGSFATFLNSLPTIAQNGFGGVGLAFEQLLGVSQEIGGQIGAVFANNIGGKLNDLQLLVQSTGVSFEQLSESVVTAFEDGKLSALEAQTALNGIAQVSQEGIPDGIGLVTEAFQNMKDAGSAGGLVLIDAIKDIGFEANELKIKDFPALIAYLKQQMPAAAADIDAVFAALSLAGITTIEGLTGATNQQLIPALASLESQGILTEASKDAESLIEQVTQLDGKEITTTLNLDVRTNFDGNTETAIKAGLDLGPVRLRSGPGFSQR